MKKIFLISLLCAVALPAVQNLKEIQVISPGGGVGCWFNGETYTINWTSNLSAETLVSITLRDANGPVRTIKASTANDGDFAWTVQNNVNPGVYRVRVQVVDGITKGDSGEFHVAPHGTLKVKSPNGGETWNLGETHNITWKATDIYGNVQLNISNSVGHIIGMIADNLPASPSSYSWKAGSYIGGSVPHGDYFIVIYSCFAPIKDVSDATFSLKLHVQPQQHKDNE
jgi:hypothetical protein